MSDQAVTEPTLRIDRTDNPPGFAVVIDDHVERFEESAYFAECFVRGVQWAAREFGVDNERLAQYGEQADSVLINSTYRNYRSAKRAMR